VLDERLPHPLGLGRWFAVPLAKWQMAPSPIVSAISTGLTVGGRQLAVTPALCGEPEPKKMLEPLPVIRQRLKAWLCSVPRGIAVSYLTVIVPTIPADSCGVQKYL
jgi:hypothetical protein